MLFRPCACGFICIIISFLSFLLVLLELKQGNPENTTPPPVKAGHMNGIQPQLLEGGEAEAWGTVQNAKNYFWVFLENLVLAFCVFDKNLMAFVFEVWLLVSTPTHLVLGQLGFRDVQHHEGGGDLVAQ